MRKKFFEIKFQVLLWVITALSICLNGYLITSQLILNDDQADSTVPSSQVAEPEQQIQPVATTQQLPVRQWSFGSSGVISLEVNKNDNLEAILASANLKQDKVAKILESLKAVTQSAAIRSGSRVQVHLNGNHSSNEENDPKKVTIFSDAYKIETSYNASSDRYETLKSKLPLEWQVKMVSGSVNGSLFSSAKKAGADSVIISQLINLFSYEIDFQRDLHAGDTFRILYEYQTDYRGKTAKNPKIIYANINQGNKKRELYRHVVAGNSVEYYDRKGSSIKRSLLKTPINGARITSSFGYRTHPVLGYSRMHQGLDYGAPKGTPILAAGDGVVTFAKNLSRGYGKHIQIKHNNSYSTLYGHLSRFANKIGAGTPIKQGQVIGYVGDTGMASGPHLHYEVIVDGKKVNPAKIKAPKFYLLQGKELAKFKDSTRKFDQMVAELNDKKNKNVALNITKNK